MSDLLFHVPARAGARRFTWLAAAPVLASALALVPPARAQTAAFVPEYSGQTPAEACDLCDVDPAGTRLPVIVTARRVPQQASETGQAVTVIDRAEIDRRQTVSVADLLATTPGVTVSRNGSVGGLTTLRIRGAEGDQTLVVIDGIRVNDPSSTGGGFDFANLLAASVERVEVLRGPGSVPWGSQAIGGVVNVLTADPAQLADGAVKARASAEYGYADQAYATAGLSGRTGALSGSLTAGCLRTDGISSAASGTERDGYRQIGATGRIGLEIAEGIGIDLRGYYADSHLRYDGFADAPPFGPADGPQSGTTQELYGYAGVHADLAEGRFRNRIAFTIADIDRDNFDPFFSSIARGRSERYEYQGDFRASDAVRVVAGAERENSRFNDGSIFADTGITSVYGQAIVKPVQPLTLTGGIRYDDHDTFGGHTTLGGDAALALGSGTTLRASYGEGFKAPTLYQLYSFYGNLGLEPETARSFDAGVQQRLLDGRASVGVTYFNRRTKNQIDFRSCVGAECAAQPFGLYDNIARTRADGVEVELALRPSDALTLTGNVSYIDAQNRSPGANFGRDLARRPHETASVDADYRFPFGLRVGGTVTMVGDSFDNAANSVRLDGYALASVRASLPLGERIEVYGRVDNVANERYQTAAGYGTYGRAAYGGVRVRLD
ncbi:TonB-dependent receptor plug domain-containing protein [Sphingomonas sp.]|uniref:TonB-dependent receptor plug domain-containing protein n=1 Tax=Sphingomonas sp. TaxID=28214 RepID=UPI003AFFD121